MGRVLTGGCVVTSLFSSMIIHFGGLSYVWIAIPVITLIMTCVCSKVRYNTRKRVSLAGKGETITGSVFGENEASKKVLTKAGFKLEGVMRNAVYKNDKVRNICHYGLYK